MKTKLTLVFILVFSLTLLLSSFSVMAEKRFNLFDLFGWRPEPSPNQTLNPPNRPKAPDGTPVPPPPPPVPDPMNES